MADSIDATGSTDEIANSLFVADAELEAIAARNDRLRQTFENEQWSGLDQLTQARQLISTARDQLADVANKIGVGGQIVREAHQKNQMVGSKESLGRS